MELRKIDTKNIWEIVTLSVREDQASFVATNTESVLEAYATQSSGGVALPFGLYHQGAPVGFVMFGYGQTGDEDEPAVAKDNYCIWRFMIDQNSQGRGLGKMALAAALEYLGDEPCGPAEWCWLSYEPENTAAKALYASAGFAENGEMCGEEIVAVLRLGKLGKLGAGASSDAVING